MYTECYILRKLLRKEYILMIDEEEYELLPEEMRPEPEMDEIDEPRKRGGGGFTAFLAFLLGIIFGIGALGGSLYYIVGYVKIKKASDFVGKFTGFQFEQLVEKDYLSEAVGDSTVLELVKGLGSAAKKQELGGFCEYFPFLEEYIDEFVQNLNNGFGIDMQTEKLLTTKLKEVPTYLSDLVKSAELGKIMRATSGTGELDPLMMELCYGQEGEDYNIVDGEVVMIPPSVATTISMLGSDVSGVLDKILLSNVIGEQQDNNIIMYLLYGKEGVVYKLVEDPASSTGKSVEMLQMQIAVLDGKVYDFYGHEMENETDGQPYTWDEATQTYTDTYGVAHILDQPVLKDGVQATVETAEGLAPLYYVKNKDGEPIKYKPTTVGDMAKGRSNLVALTDRMTLGEILGEEKLAANKFLKHLSDCTIINVADKLNDLTFGEVFEDDIYLRYEGETDFVDANGKTITKGDFIYYPTGSDDPCLATSQEEYVVKGVWKYMLKDTAAENEGKTEEERIQIGLKYSVTNDMMKIMDNMQKNMQNATLNDLNSDGIISMTSGLDTPIPEEIIPDDMKADIQRNDEGKVEIGYLTVNQMLTVMVKAIEYINNFSSLFP